MTAIRATVSIALVLLLPVTAVTAAETRSAEEREMIEMLEIFDDYDLYREMEFYVTMDETAIEQKNKTALTNKEKAGKE